MKRKLTLLLSAVMAASSLPMTAYAANFKDINDVPWAVSVINSVADKGLLSGYEDGTFRGANNVTYCEAMQMVYNVLTRTGATKGIDAVDAYSYMPVLNTYKVPSWCQMAVAYGLHNGIIDMQMVATKFAGGTQTAPREDVAYMFGNALGMFYDKDKNASTVSEFLDYWSISSNTAVQIDLLKRLGVVSGDDYKRFNPKKNINRAEMAVMLNKTNDILTEGVSQSGEITELNVNEKKYYYIKVTLDDGGWEGFNATLGDFPVYVGNTSEQISLSKLNKGDKVVLIRSGNTIVGLRQMDGVTDQEKYDITGYVNSFKDNTLSIDNENTGETDKYKLASDTDIYVDGDEVSRSELEDIIKANYNKFAYAGLMVEVEREKNDKGKYEYVTEVVEVYITFSDQYTANGKVDEFSEKRVRFKPTGSSNTKEIFFADNCKFYLDGAKKEVEDLVDAADRSTTYVKLTTNTADKATEVYMSEDAFEESTTDAMEDRVLKLEDLSDKKIKVSVGGNDYTYTFGSKNPVENIRFYLWDSDDEDGDWDDVDDDKAIDKADDWLTDGKVYCQLDFNSGGKISSIEISRTKKAWSADDDQNERKGTIESLKDGVLKFSGSNTKYTMLSKYNGKIGDNDDDDVITGPNPNDSGDVKNPLSILSAVTSSLKVFERMANDDDLELYAEIIADSDNKVQAVEARLTKAEGKLVDFNPSDKYIKIETGDGEYKLNCQKSPTLTDEEEDEFELEDLEGENSRYAGEKIELEFNSNGVVDTITVAGGSKSTNASVKVEGIATAANDGLKVKGDSKTYKWLSRTSDITVKNYSGPSESLSVVKKMIEDDSLEVYVEARLDDKDRVESISVYVREAEGELTSCDNDYVRIKTEAGNTYSFYLPRELDKLELNKLTQEQLEDGKADNKGYDVELTFEDTGNVSKIVEK